MIDTCGGRLRISKHITTYYLVQEDFMYTIYFTIAGTKFRFGDEFMESGMAVRLVKEPDNEHDTEAIKVEMDGLGHVGYVANSPHTVLGESMSAGRLYDRIGDTAFGKILYKLPQGVLCTVDEDSIIYAPPETPEEAEESMK